jgi:hypothetical protein
LPLRQKRLSSGLPHAGEVLQLRPCWTCRGSSRFACVRIGRQAPSARACANNRPIRVGAGPSVSPPDPSPAM